MEKREDHLKFCKQRALEYVDAGNLPGAFSSFNSDMLKHEETANHSALQLGMMLMLAGHLSTATQMRNYINGFN